MTSASHNQEPASIIGWIHLDALRWAFGQLERTDLTQTAKLVLLSMAGHVQDDACTVWRSQPALAALIGVSRRSLQMAIDQLVEVGEVAVEHVSVEGMRRPSRYSLPRCADRCAEIAQRSAKLGERDAQNLRRKDQVQDQDQISTSTARERKPKQEPLINGNVGADLLTFDVVGGHDLHWHLRQSLEQELRELFPGLDVLGECRKALAWTKADPKRRKTAGGMRKFLTGWLSRANDRPRPAQPAPYARTNGTTAEQTRQRIESANAKHVDLSGCINWEGEI